MAMSLKAVSTLTQVHSMHLIGMIMPSWSPGVKGTENYWLRAKVYSRPLLDDDLPPISRFGRRRSLENLHGRHLGVQVAQAGILNAL